MLNSISVRKKKKCIIIDEVQRMPNLFSILRSLVDQDRRPGRFLLLGSASPTIIRGASETLAGRIAYIELHPFNLLEIVASNQSDNPLIKHWLRGGYPDAYLQDDDEIREIWFQNFIRTYIERDLPALGLRAEPTNLRNFLVMLAHSQGDLVNYQTLSKSLGMSIPTVKKYINFFSESFIIRILKPYAKNLKKRIVKSPRIYIKDSGLLHTLLGIHTFDDLQGHPKLGKSWEGYVIEQVCQVTEGKFDPYFYRTHQGSEIDLVLEKAGQPQISIEVKYDDKPKVAKGFHIAVDDLMSPKQLYRYA